MAILLGALQRPEKQRGQPRVFFKRSCGTIARPGLGGNADQPGLKSVAEHAARQIARRSQRSLGFSTKTNPRTAAVWPLELAFLPVHSKRRLCLPALRRAVARRRAAGA